MPLDPYDKAAGMDYFTAATALAKLYRNGVTTNTFNPNMVSPAVQKYWADITQPLGAGRFVCDWSEQPVRKLRDRRVERDDESDGAGV